MPHFCVMVYLTRESNVACGFTIKFRDRDFRSSSCMAFFGSLDNWRTQSKGLGRFFKVYALDLRNHGGSPHSDVFYYPAMAEDLRKFLESHEIDSAFVLG